ncbi:MAG TPA: magnesium transporter [Polyangia bacterium]|nr:magnesium transporter [Polyangia bacterium]
MTEGAPQTEPTPAPENISDEEVRDTWPLLSQADRVLAFHLMPREHAGDFFLALGSSDQADLLATMSPAERRTWIRVLPPDDATAVVRETPEGDRAALLGLLDDATRKEVSALLAHAEDRAGGLMDPRYSRLRADMTIDEAVRYLRQQLIERRHSLPYAYVLDAEQRLVGVVPFWQLLVESGSASVRSVMRSDVISIPEDLPQEEVARVFDQHHLKALPIVDAEGHMKGVITVDDVVAVVRESATEDIQKIGGVEVLDEPYLRISLPMLLKKRVGWLAALFIGEMLTATAMGFFEKEIARAVVLALFVPLIISSGGNSGSQASTLVIRAMSLGEVRIRDWWRVMRRELVIGVGLGVVLAVIGFARIMLWASVFHVYGEHAFAVAATVAASLVGVVLWGSLAGSMLPFGLRRVGFDPASACAPLVATLVDVSGLVIYFSVAAVILHGRLL